MRGVALSGVWRVLSPVARIPGVNNGLAGVEEEEGAISP
jgi:hypothetical protein